MADELHREAIAKTKLVASPGCYPTAAILQLAPLFAQDLVQPHTVVIDAKSGISGAGKTVAAMVRLSLRERKMLELVVQGRSYSDIAETLSAPKLALERRTKGIYRKLALGSRAETAHAGGEDSFSR